MRVTLLPTWQLERGLLRQWPIVFLAVAVALHRNGTAFLAVFGGADNPCRAAVPICLPSVANAIYGTVNEGTLHCSQFYCRCIAVMGIVEFVAFMWYARI